MARLDLPYWLAFSQFNKLGPVRFKKLYSYFPELKTAWQASLAELLAAGLEPEVAQEVATRRSEFSPEQLQQQLTQAEVKVSTVLDEDYPKLLKEIYNPPPLLYYRGQLDSIADQFTLAVVGTRKISPYGQQLVNKFVPVLAHAGVTIVSGLALGVDALAHDCTLQTPGRTLAVLGSGLAWENCYPSQHRHLAQKIIASGGAVVSEFPLTMPPLTHNFPLRNRIISGLSRGCLIIEAPAESGALITAKYALEQNREIFVIPGNIFATNNAGTNQLLKQGANAVTDPADILDALDLQAATSYSKAQCLLPETATEAAIIKTLNTEPQHIDLIARQAGLNISETAAALALLEIKGLTKNLGGQNYILLT